MLGFLTGSVANFLNGRVWSREMDWFSAPVNKPAMTVGVRARQRCVILSGGRYDTTVRQGSIAALSESPAALSSAIQACNNV